MNQQTPPKDIQNHTRINNTLLSRLEKRALLWLAARMPAWVTPDFLTMIGLVAALIILLGYALTTYNMHFLWLASVGFLMQWFGDSLDGTLARFRKIERPRYGFFVDHMLDSISATLIFIGLGLSPFMRFDIALIVLVTYLLLSIYAYLVTYVNGVFRISYAGLGPTEFRLVAVLANFVAFFTGNKSFTLEVPLFGSQSMTYLDITASLLGLLMLGLVVVNTIQTSMALSEEDRAALRARRRQERATKRAQKQKTARGRIRLREYLPIPHTGGKKRSV